MQFFVLRVASNKEDRVREALVRKVKIKETEGVGDFIGSNGKPTAMSVKDQAKMLEEAERPKGEVNVKAEFKKDDKVKVTNGAFMNFEGNVDEVIADKGMVRIITTIFGRPTPLELEYWQIEKM